MQAHLHAVLAQTMQRATIKASARPAACLPACVQAQLEAVSKERGALLDEVHRLREENAELRHQVERLQQAAAAAAATAAAQQHLTAAEAETGVLAAAQEPSVANEQLAQQQQQRQDMHAGELAHLQAQLVLMQRQNAELQQQLQQAQHAAAAAAGAHAPEPAAPAAADAQQEEVGASAAASTFDTPTGAAAAAAAGGPQVSPAISQEALQEAAAAAGAFTAPPRQGGLPSELAALLPTALYMPPTADGGSAGVGGDAALQLTSSIYLLLDALEEEKRQLVAALNAKQVR